MICTASEEGAVEPNADGCVLQIHLPREVTISDSLLKLGEIGVIRGQEPVVAKARQIGLGRVSIPGQKVVVDRTVILSRLASNGISAGTVKLTGAESVTVRRRQSVITGQEFVDVARSFLKSNPPTASICAIEALRPPKDLVLSEAGQDIALTPSLARNEANDQAKVRVAVVAGGKEVGVREVAFRLKYQVRRAVSTSEIPVGAVVRPENIRIETTISDRPEPANWKPPYGQVAKQRLSVDTVVLEDMLESLKPDVMVKRNEMVVMRIESLSLLVTAVGTVMQDARAGELVKVRNVDSQRVILCKVNADGTVEPVM